MMRPLSESIESKPGRSAVRHARRRRWCIFAMLILPVAVSQPVSAQPGHEKKDLSAEASRLAESLRGRLGAGYIQRVDNTRHIVYVSALDGKHFELARRTLAGYHDAQRKGLFPEPLQWNVAVILPTLRDYRRLVPNRKVYGLYSPKTRILASISLSNVLVHEFTHALHHNDQALAGQNHPIWLTEGLACLFQSSRLDNGCIEIKSGGDLEMLQKAIKLDKAHPLGEILAMGRKDFLRDAELCYAQAHYIMLYLYRMGKLSEFYREYKGLYRSDRTGRAALEKTLGRSMERIEANWRGWVLRQKLPWRPARKQQAHLGVRMRDVPEGVEVTGFVKNSAARQAGLLKVADVIISIAGRPVRTPGDLVREVQSNRPGQIVNVEVIRGGKTILLRQLLGLMPK